MKALVSTEKIRFTVLADMIYDEDGNVVPGSFRVYHIGHDKIAYRVCQKEEENECFVPGVGCTWVECSGDCNCERSYFQDGQLYQIPQDHIVVDTSFSM